MMATNSTEAPSGSSHSSSSLTLAVSLPLVLVLLASVIAAVVYTLCCKSRHIPQFEADEKAQDSAQYTASPRYETNVATQPVRQHQQQQPIYENVHRGSTEGARDRRRDTADHETQRCHQHEDLYLQCEPLDEAIYSNDPSYPGNSAHFGPSAEDEYVVPDVL